MQFIFIVRIQNEKDQSNKKVEIKQIIGFG